jgi:hypothetical protein
MILLSMSILCCWLAFGFLGATILQIRLSPIEEPEACCVGVILGPLWLLCALG